MTQRVRTTIVGCGGMARHHVRQMLMQQDTTSIDVVCEPSPEAYQATVALFEAQNLAPPPNEPDLARLLGAYGGKLDAAFIVTPHAYHHDQSVACLEAGLDVLLEKPMVMNAGEARSLIQARDRTGKLLVVAFPGSLSPQIRKVENLVQRVAPPKGTLKEMMEHVERWLLTQALQEHGNNKTQTAASLGITREGLHKKLSKYTIDGKR